MFFFAFPAVLSFARFFFFFALVDVYGNKEPDFTLGRFGFSWMGDSTSGFWSLKREMCSTSGCGAAITIARLSMEEESSRPLKESEKPLREPGLSEFVY